MKNFSISAKAGLEIMEQFMTAKKIEPQGYSGLLEWGKKRETLGDGNTLQEKYLADRFHKWSQLRDKSETINVRKDIFDSVCLELKYKGGLSDFLTKNGYMNSNLQLLPKGDIRELRSMNPSEPKELIDKYFFAAQFIPSLVGVSPFAILLSIITYQFDGIPDYSIWVVLILFISIVLSIADSNSLRGKAYETEYFKSKGKNGFPTAYLMSFSNDSIFNRIQKLEYREKIASYFNIILMSEEEEARDQNQALILLSNAGIKVKENIKSLKIRSRNIRYGRMRNLIPATRLGAILSFLFAIPGAVLYFFDWTTLLPLSLLLSAGYFVVHKLILKRKLLRQSGEAFAEYLLTEFLSR